jgi:threonine dehydrogenase-like Zn-dependent dehydrogenase
MRALLWNGGKALEYTELPSPQPDGEEVVVEVELAGICGSDLHPYRGHPGPRVPPLVLGHEAVARLGADRYAIYPLIGCGACERCAAGEENLCARWRLIGMHRPGVFAESVAVPRSALYAVPDGMPSERAVLAEPLACAVGAVRPHGLAAGTSVVVMGCGPIGLLSVLVAARAGAQVSAIDPLAARRELALRVGASRVAETPAELEAQEAMLVVDAAGFEASWRASVDLVRSGGEVVVLGLGDAEGSFPMATLVRRGISLRGRFAYSRADFSEALVILEDPTLDLDWLSLRSLSDGALAFALLVEQPDRYVKMLLAPNGQS